nr:hypothetical protein Itr_chr11CG17020 [Ipomoea trifida]
MAVELHMLLLPDPRSDRQRHAVVHSGPFLPRLPQQLLPLISASGFQGAADDVPSSRFQSAMANNKKT